MYISIDENNNTILGIIQQYIVIMIALNPLFVILAI